MMIGKVVLGRFQLLAEAGSGGMGTVYRARDLTDGATVAVKILTGREAREAVRFEQEAAILSGLTHPAIVRYVTSGIAESGERLRWRADRRRRWRTRTSAASFTATSSPRTCSCRR